MKNLCCLNISHRYLPGFEIFKQQRIHMTLATGHPGLENLFLSSNCSTRFEASGQHDGRSKYNDEANARLNTSGVCS